jgi:hypothetical protein
MSGQRPVHPFLLKYPIPQEASTAAPRLLYDEPYHRTSLILSSSSETGLMLADPQQ